MTFEETDYPVRAANDIKESRKLVKIGYKYVTRDYGDDGKIFRKPKESFQLQNTIAAHCLQLLRSKRFIQN